MLFRSTGSKNPGNFATDPLYPLNEKVSPPSFVRYVFWYQEERMVNYDLPADSSISVVTVQDEGKSRSTLTIKNAQPLNAGNYTCKPSNAIAASIQVFVSEGKQSLNGDSTVPKRVIGFGKMIRGEYCRRH